jgi:hypothetical protein
MKDTSLTVFPEIDVIRRYSLRKTCPTITCPIESTNAMAGGRSRAAPAQTASSG